MVVKPSDIVKNLKSHSLILKKNKELTQRFYFFRFK